MRYKRVTPIPPPHQKTQMNFDSLLLLFLVSISNLISGENLSLGTFCTADQLLYDIDCGPSASYGTTDELKSYIRFNNAQPWYIYLTTTYTSTFSTTSTILTSTEVDSDTVSYTIFSIAATDVPNAYYTLLPPSPPPPILQLPLTFELIPSSIYNFVNFFEAVTTVVDYPYKTGLDTTNKVAQFVKASGISGELGFSTLTLTDPIDFSTKTTIKMLVWSPQIISVRLVFRPIGSFFAVGSPTVATTIVSAWEELTFDLIGIVNSNNYQIIEFLLNFGSQVPNPATYYFDNVRQV